MIEIHEKELTPTITLFWWELPRARKYKVKGSLRILDYDMPLPGCEPYAFESLGELVECARGVLGELSKDARIAHEDLENWEP